MVDWSVYDPEGAMRQRYIDLDELTDRVRERVAKSNLGWNQFQEMFDSLLSGFHEKRNDKFRVEESIVLLKKVGAAHDLYKRNHGKDY